MKILFEGMELEGKRIKGIRRRGHAIYYRDPAGAWNFLYGYHDPKGAKSAKKFLSSKLREP